MARPKIFVMMQNIEDAWNEAKFGTKPRDLNDEDLIQWNTSLDNPQKKIESLEQARAVIRRSNAFKWNEYKRNYRWVQKQMIKLGLNPEDARYLL